MVYLPVFGDNNGCDDINENGDDSLNTSQCGVDGFKRGIMV